MSHDSPSLDRAAKLIDRLDERAVLDRLVDAVRAGESRVLVLRGEPGIGKTMLLDYVSKRAADCRVERAAGLEPEMELPFAGLHQLCAPMFDGLDRLPEPRREALRTAFGLSAGPAPNAFHVALAVLNLISDVAAERPLICLVDDAQWQDRASALVLGFVARRLRAEPVGLIFAARTPSAHIGGLPEMPVKGLRAADTRALLDSVLLWPVDERVRDQIIAETGGNPLALLELPRGLSPAELAGGFGLPAARPLSGRIEESFRRQLSALPGQTQRLLLVAAAEPSGNAALIWQAARKLNIDADAAVPAVESGLAEFGSRVRFRHPLARSAVYQSASVQGQREVHAALADVTDPVADRDRRAWHRAQAAPGPDETVAAELEHCAGRAQRRGGLAAAAAFLERAATLTPDPGRRAGRLLAAARAKRDAGEPDAALGLLAAAETSPLDELQAAEVEHLRGQLALDQRRGADAGELLLRAARHLEPVNAALARITYLEAFWAAIWAGEPARLREAAAAAWVTTADPAAHRTVDTLLDALALRFTEGYAAAAPTLTSALELLMHGGDVAEVERWNWHPGALVALEMWDFESWQAIAASQVRIARETGALVHLQFALTYLARTCILAGELAAAARLVEEDQLIAAATGNPPFEYSAMLLAAWRGEEAKASGLIKEIMEDVGAGGQQASPLGVAATFAACATSVLRNGLGQHDAAYAAVRHLLLPEPTAYLLYAPIIMPELAEAAYRIGDLAPVRTVLERLSERSRVTPNDWAQGVEARVRAFLGEGSEADHSYRESVKRLRNTPLRAELARSQLLYGEWLRRERRRGEAREQLRAAHDAFAEMGMQAFAKRARRELILAGEQAARSARTHGDPAREALTPQEAQVARLARDGLSNPEIAARLFISPRTVQYHLSKVFTKLGISSRGQLHLVLRGVQI